MQPSSSHLSLSANTNLLSRILVKPEDSLLSSSSYDM